MTTEEAIAILEVSKHMATSGRMYNQAIDMAIESLKAEPMWITDRKPTESGRYMATVDSLGWIHVVIFRYGKPSMTNRKVKGMCWYYPDDEWGDVVYDDDEILGWMPLPEPYKERNE
jgi:hypothetical protein